MAFIDTQWMSETKSTKEDPAKSAKIKEEKAQARERENARIRAYEQEQAKKKD